MPIPSNAFDDDEPLAQAVQVRWVDFNPAITPWEKMFDGAPFKEWPRNTSSLDWLADAIRRGHVQPHNTGGVDCAHWRVGEQNAMPGDWIVRQRSCAVIVMTDNEFCRKYERKD